MVIEVAAGSWLVFHGLTAGVLRKRLRRPYGVGGYYEGRAAVVEGVFRMAVGVALIALVVWLVGPW